MSEDLDRRASDFFANLASFLERAEDDVQTWITKEYVGIVGDVAAPSVTARVNGVGAIVSIDVSVLAKRSLDNISMGEAISQAVARAEESAAEGKAEFLAGLRVGGVDVGGILARGEHTMQDWTGGA